jgi:hypothetical protein
MYLPPSQESLGLHRATPAVPGAFSPLESSAQHARVSFRERVKHEHRNHGLRERA